MKLTPQQRAALGKRTQTAALMALRCHFLGDGAAGRCVRFARQGLHASAAWTAKIIFVMSWAAIGGLLAGPYHDFFLTQVRAWMVATPADQVLAQTHLLFMAAFWTAVKAGALVGFGRELRYVVSPSIEDAKQGFLASVS